jgi:hypothetical protein
MNSSFPGVYSESFPEIAYYMSSHCIESHLPYIYAVLLRHQVQLVRMNISRPVDPFVAHLQNRERDIERMSTEGKRRENEKKE